MTETQEKPDAGEKYTTAINTRSLVVSQHEAGAVDVIAAGAWSLSRLGQALMRLHGEYDGGERLRGGAGQTDVVLLGRRLKSLPVALEQLSLWADTRGIQEPRRKVLAVLGWWLDKTCRTCDGQRWRVVKGTPHLSGDLCQACRGAGAMRLPHGDDGRAIATRIDVALDAGTRSLKARLRGMRK